MLLSFILPALLLPSRLAASSNEKFYVLADGKLQEVFDDPSKVQPERWVIEVFPADVPATYENWDAMKEWGGIRDQTEAGVMAQLKKCQAQQDENEAWTHRPTYYTYRNYLGPIAVMKRTNSPSIADQLKKAYQQNKPSAGMLWDPDLSGGFWSDGDDKMRISADVDKWIQKILGIKDAIDTIRALVTGHDNPFSSSGSTTMELIGPYLDALGKLRKLQQMLQGGALDNLSQVNSMLASVNAELAQSHASADTLKGSLPQGGDDAAAKSFAAAVGTLPVFDYIAGTTETQTAEETGSQVTVHCKMTNSMGEVLFSVDSTADLKDLTSAVESDDPPSPGLVMEFKDGTVHSEISGSDQMKSLLSSIYQGHIMVQAPADSESGKAILHSMSDALNKYLNSRNGDGSKSPAGPEADALQKISEFVAPEMPPVEVQKLIEPKDAPPAVATFGTALSQAIDGGSKSVVALFTSDAKATLGASPTTVDQLAALIAGDSTGQTTIGSWSPEGSGYLVALRRQFASKQANGSNVLERSSAIVLIGGDGKIHEAKVEVSAPIAADESNSPDVAQAAPIATAAPSGDAAGKACSFTFEMDGGADRTITSVNGLQPNRLKMNSDLASPDLWECYVQIDDDARINISIPVTDAVRGPEGATFPLGEQRLSGQIASLGVTTPFYRGTFTYTAADNSIYGSQDSDHGRDISSGEHSNGTSPDGAVLGGTGRITHFRINGNMASGEFSVYIFHGDTRKEFKGKFSMYVTP